MTIVDSMRPLELGHVAEHYRQRYALTFPGVGDFGKFNANPSAFLVHVMQSARFVPGIQLEASDDGGCFDALLKVESVDRATQRVELRVLRVYEAPRVPEAELTAGNLAVRWRQESKSWAIVTLDPEPEVVRAGFPTEAIAARALAALAGTNKKRRQAA